jgi:hypothetical protein
VPVLLPVSGVTVIPDARRAIAGWRLDEAHLSANLGGTAASLVDTPASAFRQPLP